MVGRRLGHYRIRRQLGAGGMGEVYLAEDTTLRREVALKVLPEALADDPERRARFEREARAVAALNHPNIVTVHSVEEHDGLLFLTMELLSGCTLSKLIPAGGMPLAELLPLALQMAGAAAAAHQQGVTHRDLKPDNVMVDEEGRLKILDFGLARLDPALLGAEGADTLPTVGLTQEGTLLGTLAYMSPEQAEGKPADARSDVFSLGVILFQMITGRLPFAGDSQVSTLTSILRDEPASITDLRPDLPRYLGRIVKRCLIKDPSRRYQSAVELRNELEELKEELDSGELDGPAAALPAAPGARRDWKPLAVGALAAAAVLIVAWALWGRKPPSRPAESPPGYGVAQLTFQGAERGPTLSPDGKMLAYAGVEGDIHLLRVGGTRTINLTADEPAVDHQPAFSPDGQHIAFRSERAGGGIFVMGATGESVRRLTDFGYDPDWSPDGARIVVGTNDGTDWASRFGVSQLWIVDVASGRSERLYDAGDATQPAWSPDGRWIAFRTAQDLWAVPSEGGDPVQLTEGPAVEWHPVWSPGDGELYFLGDRSGSMNLWALPIDLDTGAAAGAPKPMTLPVAHVAGFALDQTGRRVAFAAEDSTDNIQLMSFDADAETVGKLEAVTRGSNYIFSAAPSPDGEWLAFANDLPQEDIFLVRTDGTGLVQLTNDAAKDRVPAWRPDGSIISFYSNREGSSYTLWSIRPDGSGLQRIVSDARSLTGTVWSPDGRRLASGQVKRGLSVILEVGDDGTATVELELPPPADGLRFSPASWSDSGRQLAGQLSGPDGSAQGVAVYSFASGEFERLTEFGGEPRWLRDERRLLFRDSQRVYLLDTASRRLTELTSVAPDSLTGVLGLTTDERRIYVCRLVRETHIWLATRS